MKLFFLILLMFHVSSKCNKKYNSENISVELLFIVKKIRNSLFRLSNILSLISVKKNNF